MAMIKIAQSVSATLQIRKRYLNVVIHFVPPVLTKHSSIKRDVQFVARFTVLSQGTNLREK